MFAVVVLGIGFIMIAAMFPVAISQSKSTQEETNAAAIARGGVNYLKTIATEVNMPPTNTAPGTPDRVVPFTSPGNPPTTPNVGSWEAVRGNLILPNDPRYAFVPLYRRQTGSTSAQVFVVATQVRARPRYDEKDTLTPTTAGEGNLQAHLVEVTVTEDPPASGIYKILFDDPVATGPDMRQAVAEGAYVIIARDPGHAASSSPTGTFNGRVYRIGAQFTDATGAPVLNTWTFQPGNEYVPQAGPDGIVKTGDDYEIGTACLAYIVGRELKPSGEFTGPVQDISIYTSFIQVRP
ncbi:MAG: hypothetical protein WBD40_00985 [Tepidisphaeraceae bacterium]